MTNNHASIVNQTPPFQDKIIKKFHNFYVFLLFFLPKKTN